MEDVNAYKNMSKADKDKMIAEFKYMQELYSNEYRSIINRINDNTEHLNMLYTAQESIENADIIKDKEILSFVGESIFIPSKIINNDKFIVGVGSAFFVEVDAENTKRIISKYINKANNELKKLNNNKKEIEAALFDMSFQMNKLNVLTS
ncbi:MAG: prefoldin subunit alpha [Candidatus Marsarchaeota archaeon]|jgi:prefoldin alpha subunit|nr:prefoldin subunit alpha [Candidatus Marsarchaeota archaeon]